MAWKKLIQSRYSDQTRATYSLTRSLLPKFCVLVPHERLLKTAFIDKQCSLGEHSLCLSTPLTAFDYYPTLLKLGLAIAPQKISNLQAI